jgi:sorting and assembly machinery component 37
MSSLQLYIEPAAFDLPCLSAESLAALAHLQNVAPASFVVHRTANAAALVTGKLPSLHDTASETWTAGFAAIVEYLSKQGLTADESLTARERAESVALQVLVEQRASDLIKKAWFCDEENYVAVRSLLGKALPIPFNYILPNKLRKAAIDSAEADTSLLPLPGSKRSVTAAAVTLAKKQQITQDAEDLYGIIERQLSDKAYLFGKHVTSCDAFVCGHLSTHLFSGLPKPILADLLKESFPRTRSYLVSFVASLRPVELAPAAPASLGNMVNGLLRELFGSRRGPAKSVEPTAEEFSKRLKDRKEKLFFAGASILGLIGFVLYHGIISFDLEDDEVEFMDSEEFNDEGDEEDLSDELE